MEEVLMKGLIALFLLSFSTLFADEPAAGRGGSLYQTLMLIAVAGLFFYFILWRPEQKRRKAAEQQRGSLQKGDKVTAMGIVGEVSSIKENTVILKMVDGAKIEFLKAAITDVQKPSVEVQDKDKS